MLHAQGSPGQVSFRGVWQACEWGGSYERICADPYQVYAYFIGMQSEPSSHHIR